jgi:hypothetical protein
MLYGGAMQRNRILALALDPNIIVNSTSMSWAACLLAAKVLYY